jgi:hypothetical protein
MRNDRVFLAEWHSDNCDDYHDIPWPRVHDLVGQEIIRWINGQQAHDAQMIIEHDNGFGSNIIKLYVEFFRPSLRSEFALRFAK